MVSVTAPVGEWPEDGSVSSELLLENGWTPVGFGQFLFKVVSRCNLNCSYCYVYNLQDDSWRSKPRVMSDEVIDQAVLRIAEHAAEHHLTRAGVVLHGGEPLLAGLGFFRNFVGRVRRGLPDLDLRFTVQTNGTLLTGEVLDTFRELGVIAGISIDGGREANDAHRLYPSGRSSYDEVVRAVALINEPRHRNQFAGLLCTIDITQPSLDVYHSLLELDPPWVDLLLPHGTWSAPPPGLESVADVSPAPTPYADWLIPIFDEWYSQRTKPVQIRIFEEIMNLLMGGRSRYESFGVQPVNLLVIESDGTLEQVDSLKAAFNGAAATGLNVFDNSFDDALHTPAVIARQIGYRGLCQTCLSCDLVSVCGGGLYPHRHKVGTGFLNPSVYCADFKKLIGHVRARLERDLNSVRLPEAVG
ncbi:MAG: FxsB family radical SAM/SPASM domain protein [Actinobacteria bacterium]|nr:FxsB family radical SAM/SPASM domain protein [Actinomycetota bacterium]